jgi:hypothetical protein
VSTNFTESLRIAPTMREAMQKLMQSYVKYLPRKKQSITYTGSNTIT